MTEVALLERPLARFLEALASGTPTPGGGSAAGLVGALAAGLVAMVARLTVEKKGFESKRERMGELIEEAEAGRAALAQLIEEDAAAFEAVMAAFRLPKETEAQKEARRERVQAALRRATEVPAETARRCVAVLELAVQAAAEGNPNAVSDAGAAAHLARAAAEAALLNVAINLGSLQDEAFRAEHERLRETLARRAAEAHAHALEAVQSRLG